MIRLIIPIMLGTLFFWQLFDDINAEGGFIRTPQGEWILPNCVGVGVLLLVPVLSFILSLAKGRRDIEEQQQQEQDLKIKALFPPTRLCKAVVHHQLRQDVGGRYLY